MKEREGERGREGKERRSMRNEGETRRKRKREGGKGETFVQRCRQILSRG